MSAGMSGVPKMVGIAEFTHGPKRQNGPERWS